MLRESSLATNTAHDLMAVTDRSRDPLIAGGTGLLDLADAALGLAEDDLGAARQRVTTELGPEALVDAAAVFATFEMMNRVADGTGIPVGRGRLASTADIRQAANLDALRHD